MFTEIIIRKVDDFAFVFVCMSIVLSFLCRFLQVYLPPLPSLLPLGYPHLHILPFTTYRMFPRRLGLRAPSLQPHLFR